ncbi:MULTISPECIES: bacterial transcriptional activator domain-containing protein [unclassified Mycobacterium]|uniref:AfsR/SARP family transcriptional regulator n=1 Tax=unclassified Mycobacterium TaxID=2642494 RepID=UPI0029C96E70|nr:MULTISPECIES: bacterial transcriptional activator domain-containing protein [unclassified Mycobacterium]
MGIPAPLRSGGKAERLLSALAMQARSGVHRETLVERIWPGTSHVLSYQSLNTLVHELKIQLADALGGQPPIVHMQAHYLLNLDGGLKVDVVEFESAVDAGDRFLSEGATAAAIDSYQNAVLLYRGDLTSDADISGLLERERLRAVCLNALARLADANFALENYEQALAYAVRLLGVDPCREDAHRMTMRAYVRLGARAQALRQYNVCRLILAEEFDATPEPATEQLFQLIRTDPGHI